MGVVISGIEMPKNCLDCPCLNGEEMYCQVTRKNLGLAFSSLYKASNCPLIPFDKGLDRKRGKWIYQFHEDEVGVTCSECEGYAESFARWIYDEGYRIDYNFCPNCGARMVNE